MHQDSFLNNSLVYDATLRNLEILGEAAKYIPESIRAAHPDVEWQKIREFRNFVTHAYFPSLIESGPRHSLGCDYPQSAGVARKTGKMQKLRFPDNPANG